ncbi:hypothetical protein A2U01_0104306, partial [Trifolium medium]|nr:hypothetical protein [Trifolium medium]
AFSMRLFGWSGEKNLPLLVIPPIPAMLPMAGSTLAIGSPPTDTVGR